jgi:hypothetical protein
MWVSQGGTGKIVKTIRRAPGEYWLEVDYGEWFCIHRDGRCWSISNFDYDPVDDEAEYEPMLEGFPTKRDARAALLVHANRNRPGPMVSFQVSADRPVGEQLDEMLEVLDLEDQLGSDSPKDEPGSDSREDEPRSDSP